MGEESDAIEDGKRTRGWSSTERKCGRDRERTIARDRERGTGRGGEGKLGRACSAFFGRETGGGLAPR